MFSALPDAFLEETKSPCWRNASSPEQEMLCLPYFYILGNFQSAVRDMADRVSRHDDVLARRPAATRCSKFVPMPEPCAAALEWGSGIGRGGRPARWQLVERGTPT